MASDKIIELARKFNNLVKQGEGGEQMNAVAMLKKIMDDHNLTIEQIEGEEITEHCFKVHDHYEKLFHQVVSSIIYCYTLYGYSKERTVKGVSKKYTRCTAAEAVEIQVKFDFYLAAYQKEESIFYKAFVHKQRIFHPDSMNIDTDAPLPTPEERAENLRIAQMMESIDRKHYLKQISKPE